MYPYIPYAELLRLDGKAAIITGGGAGIGFGIARRLAEAGASVTVADVSASRAAEAAQKLAGDGAHAIGIAADVTSQGDLDHIVAATVSAFGSVDILVNNAGIYPPMPVMTMPDELFDRVLSVNLRGVFLASKRAAGEMIKRGRGGKIINVTSIDALHPSMIGLAHYDASKHAVWGFTKNLALELAPHNISVNAIAPGGITTEGTRELTAGAPAAVDMDAFTALIPMHRFGEPDEIGKVALFLASDMSSYMTGSQIVVDGGRLLG